MQYPDHGLIQEGCRLATLDFEKPPLPGRFFHVPSIITPYAILVFEKPCPIGNDADMLGLLRIMCPICGESGHVVNDQIAEKVWLWP
jgi:hypothetical protein